MAEDGTYHGSTISRPDTMGYSFILFYPQNLWILNFLKEQTNYIIAYYQWL